MWDRNFSYFCDNEGLEKKRNFCPSPEASTLFAGAREKPDNFAAINLTGYFAAEILLAGIV